MRFSTLAAAMAVAGLAFGCAVQPEPPDQPRVEAVQPLPFSKVQMKAVDAGSSYMKRLVEHVAIDRQHAPGALQSETEEWVIDRGATPVTDVYLSAPTRDELARYIASDPTLTVPANRELAFGRLDDSGRWRTYLLTPAVELDGADIAHAELARDADTAHATLTLDFNAVGAERLHDVTARLVGQKLAILVDGSVVAAPVITSAISGGRAAITFAQQL